MEGLIGILILGFLVWMLFRHPLKSLGWIFKIGFLLILGFVAFMALFFFMMSVGVLNTYKFVLKTNV